MSSEPCGPVGYFRSATKRMIMFNRMNLFYVFYLFVELGAGSARVQRSAKGLNSKMQSGFKILTVDSISSPCQAYQKPVFCVVAALRCCHASIYHVKMMKRTLTSDEHMTYDCSHREKTHLQSRMIFVSTACHAPNIDPETSTTGHLDRHLAQLI